MNYREGEHYNSGSFKQIGPLLIELLIRIYILTQLLNNLCWELVLFRVYTLNVSERFPINLVVLDRLFTELHVIEYN